MGDSLLSKRLKKIFVSSDNTFQPIWTKTNHTSTPVQIKIYIYQPENKRRFKVSNWSLIKNYYKERRKKKK